MSYPQSYRDLVGLAAARHRWPGPARRPHRLAVVAGEHHPHVYFVAGAEIHDFVGGIVFRPRVIPASPTCSPSAIRSDADCNGILASTIRRQGHPRPKVRFVMGTWQFHDLHVLHRIPCLLWYRHPERQDGHDHFLQACAAVVVAEPSAGLEDPEPCRENEVEIAVVPELGTDTRTVPGGVAPPRPIQHRRCRSTVRHRDCRSSCRLPCAMENWWP